jgi:hypothetical protein
VWISDDREALRFARFQKIATRETIDIMSIAVADGDISAPDAFDLMNQMADSDRYLRFPVRASVPVVGGLVRRGHLVMTTEHISFTNAPKASTLTKVVQLAFTARQRLHVRQPGQDASDVCHR